MVSVVFFDIDNTLLSFDGYVKETMKAGFSEFGICRYEDSMFSVFKTINDRLWEEIEQGQLTTEELRKIRWNLIFNALGIRYDGPTFEVYFREQLDESAIPEPGALEVLCGLSAKYPLCAASNGPYSQQKNRLRIAGMLPYFSHLFVSSDIGFPKPAKEFFAACLEQLYRDDTIKQPLYPENILMVGDSLSADIAGAAAFGMKTCFYNPLGASVPQNLQPDHTVSALPELLSLL